MSFAIYHLLCDDLPFNVTLTCRRAAYPRPGLLCASDHFLIRKTFIYNLPCSLQCALQCRLSSLHCGQDLCRLALTGVAASCAGRKGASAAGVGVGDGGCFTCEITQGFHFPLVLCLSQHIEIVLPEFGSAASLQPKSHVQPLVSSKNHAFALYAETHAVTNDHDKNQILIQGELLRLQ